MPASDNDLQVGFDPTGYTSISGAQLGQLVNSASPYNDKGLTILTTDQAGVPDVPDANTTTKWQNYLWIRVSPLTTSVGVYAWNPAQLFNISYTDGSTNFVQSNWNPISVSSIPAGSIFGFMIAPATITKDKIVSVDVSQVEGLNLSNYVQTITQPTAGDISGSFSVGFTVTALAITAAKLAAGAVTLAKLDASAGLQDQVYYNIGAASVAWGYVYNLLTSQAAKVTPVAADYIQILDSAAGFVGKKVLLSNLSAYLNTLTTSRFTSALTALPANTQGAILNVAHGLQVNAVNVVPGRIRAYLKMIDAGGEAGYAQNDTVEIGAFSDDDTQRACIAVGANSTNVFASIFTTTANQFQVPKKDGSGFSGLLTPAKWQFQLIAEI